MPIRRRRLLAFIGLGVCLGAMPSQSHAQEDTRYWPLREINFPVPVDRLPAGASKPAKLRFSVRPEGGQWREAESRAPDNLDLIDRSADRRGFRYTSPADGSYDFCLQQEMGNGERVPRDGELTPQYKVIFDTKPPIVRVNRTAATTIEWDVSDENLLADGIQIEARWAGTPTFMPINPRGFRPKPRDTYTWVAGPDRNDLHPGDKLDVRVVARDKANHSTSSEIVRLALEGGDANSAPEPRGESTPRGADRNPGIEYSNSRDLKILSKVQQVTRSGITKSHLFVRTPETNWAKVKEQPEAIAPDAKDPVINWKYSVERDGRYGFIVIPENGAGGRDPDPRDADPAQFLIEVDTVAPKVTEVAASSRSGPGGTPQVEITWRAEDANLEAYPIRIEYSETGDPNGKWISVNGDRGPLPNSGRFTWTVGDEVKPWKFFVRVSATDMAKQTGQGTTKEPVKVDLATPKATIETIAAANGARAQSPRDNSVQPTAGSTPQPLPFRETTLAPKPDILPPSGKIPDAPLPVLPSPASGTNREGGPALPPTPPIKVEKIADSPPGMVIPTLPPPQLPPNP